MFLTKYVENQKRQIQKDKNKELAKNIFTGMAIGAVAGILLAPQSGEETRNDIRDKSIEITDDIKNNIEVKKNNINNWKTTFTQIKSDIKDRIEEGNNINSFTNGQDEDDIIQESIVVENIY